MTGPAHSGTHHLLAFDSGIGGLGIVRALRTLNPALAIEYLADTAVFPYGEQDDAFLVERILTLISEAISRLRPQAVVIACNTASTLALDALRAAWPDMPFIGCVPPIRWAARITRSHVIGLLATRATIRRPYLTHLHGLYAPECKLIAHAAPGLAACAEHLFRGEDVPARTIQQEIAGLFERDTKGELDVVGLGCTHYTFVLDQLRALSPARVTWLDPANAVARHALSLLQNHPEHTPPTFQPHAWFTSMPPDAEALRRKLPDFGFEDIALWENLPTSEKMTA
ncbi:glutamate racemase [Acetobacter tropicalis]|uniref:Glutamate racemase n=1 Tax=Acetobacter tropicalis TaxID=104102 RepID=A0A252ABC0_9PROT|nr:aspartate/glutamate racemase family protein [Acetobacter tropicalis]OUI86881.1 glutamate racemase [Acetobacter tropicalis]